MVDRIEKGVYVSRTPKEEELRGKQKADLTFASSFCKDNVEDLAHLAFWNYNTTLLLHLLRSDEGLEISCHEMSLLLMLEVGLRRLSLSFLRRVEFEPHLLPFLRSFFRNSSTPSTSSSSELSKNGSTPSSTPLSSTTNPCRRSLEMSPSRESGTSSNP